MRSRVVDLLRISLRGFPRCRNHICVWEPKRRQKTIIICNEYKHGGKTLRAFTERSEAVEWNGGGSVIAHIKYRGASDDTGDMRNVRGKLTQLNFVLLRVQVLHMPDVKMQLVKAQEQSVRISKVMIHVYVKAHRNQMQQCQSFHLDRRNIILWMWNRLQDMYGDLFARIRRQVVIYLCPNWTRSGVRDMEEVNTDMQVPKATKTGEQMSRQRRMSVQCYINVVCYQ